MARLLVSSKLLTEAANVGVSFRQTEGTTLRDVRNFFRIPDAMVRERGCSGEAPRSNPDFRLAADKQYELVLPSRTNGWSRDVCGNAARLLVYAVNVPAVCFTDPLKFIGNSLYMFAVLLHTSLRLVVIGWIFVVGLFSTGLIVPMQALYWLFSVALATIAKPCADELPTVTVQPFQFVFTTTTCFLAVIGSVLLLQIFLLASVNQLLLLLLDLASRLLSFVVSSIVLCFRGDRMTARKRVSVVAVCVSIPVLNAVPFFGGEFLARGTFLLWAYILLIVRLRLSRFSQSNPVAWQQLSRQQRALTIQYCLLWMLPAILLISMLFVTDFACVFISWLVLALSQVVPLCAR